jgi:hypothetical protein
VAVRSSEGLGIGRAMLKRVAVARKLEKPLTLSADLTLAEAQRGRAQADRP